MTKISIRALTMDEDGQSLGNLWSRACTESMRGYYLTNDNVNEVTVTLPNLLITRLTENLYIDVGIKENPSVILVQSSPALREKEFISASQITFYARGVGVVKIEVSLKDKTNNELVRIPYNPVSINIKVRRGELEFNEAYRLTDNKKVNKRT